MYIYVEGIIDISHIKHYISCTINLKLTMPIITVHISRITHKQFHVRPEIIHHTLIKGYCASNNPSFLEIIPFWKLRVIGNTLMGALYVPNY